MKINIQIRKARPEDNEEVTDFAFEIMRSMGIEPDPENIDYALATFGQERGIPLSEFVVVDGERLIGSIIDEIWKSIHQLNSTKSILA